VVVVTLLATVALRQRRHPRLAGTVLVLSVAVGLFGGFTNVATF
jgi:hypothetical protein